MTFEWHGTGVAAVEIQVFDLAGARVFSARASGTSLRFDGLDHSGRPLANGVYLYWVSARGADGKVWRGGVEKLVLLR